MFNYENIPAELKAVKQWVCWDDSKLPKNPKTGGNAQSNNKSTWGTFNEAVAAVSKYGFKGVGFMFDPKTGYFGVDLDKCLASAEESCASLSAMASASSIWEMSPIMKLSRE